MTKFGAKISYVDAHHLHIQGNQRFIGGNHQVEADYSQLAFFAALGTLNNGIKVGRFALESKQGDKAIIAILQKMGAKIIFNDGYYEFYPSSLQGTTIDLEDCPDLGPMLFALSTQAQGQTTFINAKRLRIKESDRIRAMEEELRKLGCEISSSEDTVYVRYHPNLKPLAELDGHNDHRIVMALSILATIAQDDVAIVGSQAIAKSYPHFFEDLASAKIKVEHHEDN